MATICIISKERWDFCIAALLQTQFTLKYFKNSSLFVNTVIHSQRTQQHTNITGPGRLLMQYVSKSLKDTFLWQWENQ